MNMLGEEETVGVEDTVLHTAWQNRVRALLRVSEHVYTLGLQITFYGYQIHLASLDCHTLIYHDLVLPFSSFPLFPHSSSCPRLRGFSAVWGTARTYVVQCTSNDRYLCKYDKCETVSTYKSWYSRSPSYCTLSLILVYPVICPSLHFKFIST